MFHLAAYFASALGNVADTEVNAAVDSIYPINNNHLTLPTDRRLIGAYAGSATLNRVKIETPQFRQVSPPYVRPINVNLLPPTNANMMILDYNPMTLRAWEEIVIKATSAVAMTEAFFAGLWLSDGVMNTPTGNLYTLRATSTTAAVQGVWTPITLTWADTLPSGVYAMTLSECFSTTGVFHRWTFSGQNEKPGYLSGASNAIRLPDGINKAQFGTMGTFRSNDLPRLEVMCNAADNAHTVFAHCAKVGNL